MQAVSAEAVTVKTERGTIVAIPAQRPMNLQHGYATTIHSSQGLTSNRVLIEANTRSLTTNRAAFYVAISRPRYELKLYTDRAAELRGAVARVPKKFAALHSSMYCLVAGSRNITLAKPFWCAISPESRLAA